MNIESIELSKTELQKLFGAASGDVVLLYLYLRCGNPPEEAARTLGLHDPRYSCAAATLRQMGMWQEPQKNMVFPGERPNYSEQDVIQTMDSDAEFRMLNGEVQRLLGRTLNTEELKILLGFVRYLGFPPEVIAILVSYCKERARRRGSLRNPSLRTIEKEAYEWAEQGIDSLEAAAAFIQVQNQKSSRMAHLMGLLQIRGRNLTQAEEKYANAWLEAGFDDEAISMAYERTCLNTGALSWPYMNKILQRWHQQGLHTGKQIQSGDRKPPLPKGASGELGEAEMEAIRAVLQEG